jgi:hypothetical protein
MEETRTRPQVAVHTDVELDRIAEDSAALILAEIVGVLPFMVLYSDPVVEGRLAISIRVADNQVRKENEKICQG